MILNHHFCASTYIIDLCVRFRVYVFAYHYPALSLSLSFNRFYTTPFSESCFVSQYTILFVCFGFFMLVLSIHSMAQWEILTWFFDIYIYIVHRRSVAWMVLASRSIPLSNRFRVSVPISSKCVLCYGPGILPWLR